jgi:diguanylate cyclase
LVSAGHGQRRGSTWRQSLIFAAITLVPVILLGVSLARSYRAEAGRRGLAQGRSEALLFKQTAVEPLLDGRPLSQGLTATEKARLNRLSTTATSSLNIQGLRLGDLDGKIVYSDDGSGLDQRPQAEAVDAAKGESVARLTQVTAATAKGGGLGPASVEVYLPLQAGPNHNSVGMMEIYLPYNPIRLDVNEGLHTLYWDLALGLVALYLVLFGISYWNGHRLRRQVRLNAYLAEHDTLTDLPNRVLFHRLAEQALERGRQTGRSTTIAIIDLDQFKEINDTLGHGNGDRLLAAIGSRLASHVQQPDGLARLGGDEFGVVLSNADDPEAVLTSVRQEIQRDTEIDGLPLSIEASIGYAVSPADGSEVDDLLQHADVAMYVAKRTRSGVVGYDPSQYHYDATNLSLATELRQAISLNQLVLHYQPKIDLADRALKGFEALVRWEHPTHGLLYPDRFLPLLEPTDLIDDLTAWVMGQALHDLVQLGDQQPGLTMAVNISARNLGHIEFADTVVEALGHADVAPERLTVELTETALMVDPTKAGVVLSQIGGTGAQVSIDDFGTGQTALRLLTTLPIHELKIDRSFVADLLVNPAHLAIVRSIVELGHNLGFTVVGEGVESIEVLDRLTSTGCDMAQGFLIARPMPLADLVTHLRQSTSATQV